MKIVTDLSAIRDEFPALADGVYFDNGTVSLTPRPVADELARYLADVLNGGPPHVVTPDSEYARRERTRERIASFLGTTGDRLALMRGVSEAYQTVLRGLTWRPGDEVVITEDEEAALLLPTLHLRDVCGVRVVKLPFVGVVEDPARALEAALTERTRLVAVSHVTTTLGYRYPIAEICSTARSHGVLTFVDLAHSGGIVPFALDSVGCDLAGILSYKWMYGPYAAGALYADPAAVDRVDLRFAGNRSEVRLDPATDSYVLRDDARRFEYGPWSWPLAHAWASALDFLDRVGRNDIWTRTQQLLRKLQDGLREAPGVTVLTPHPPDAAALVTFELEGVAASYVRDRLAARRIRIKALPDDRRLRASIALFTSDEDVEGLIRAVDELEK